MNPAKSAKSWSESLGPPSRCPVDLSLLVLVQKRSSEARNKTRSSPRARKSLEATQSTEDSTAIHSRQLHKQCSVLEAVPKSLSSFVIRFMPYAHVLHVYYAGPFHANLHRKSSFAGQFCANLIAFLWLELETVALFCNFSWSQCLQESGVQKKWWVGSLVSSRTLRLLQLLRPNIKAIVDMCWWVFDRRQV